MLQNVGMSLAIIVVLMPLALFGVLGLAAVLSGAVPETAGRRVGVVLSGGNVDLRRFASLVSDGASGEV